MMTSLNPIFFSLGLALAGCDGGLSAGVEPDFSQASDLATRPAPVPAGNSLTVNGNAITLTSVGRSPSNPNLWAMDSTSTPLINGPVGLTVQAFTSGTGCSTNGAAGFDNATYVRVQYLDDTYNSDTSGTGAACGLTISTLSTDSSGSLVGTFSGNVQSGLTGIILPVVASFNIPNTQQ